MLRQLGISPDALVLRSDRPLNQSIKDKISLMCDVDAEGVVNCVDANSIFTCTHWPRYSPARSLRSTSW